MRGEGWDQIEVMEYSVKEINKHWSYQLLLPIKWKIESAYEFITKFFVHNNFFLQL